MPRWTYNGGMFASFALALATAKLPYRFDAQFVECCSCKDTCVSEITGRDVGCHGMGALSVAKGTYGGRDISGTSVAFAWDSGKWVRIYVDASESKRAAAISLIKAALADWGKLLEVRPASIRISATAGNYGFWVDGGRTMTVTVKPVLGGNGLPVTHTNLSSPLHSTLMQGETVSAGFWGPNAFELKGTNGFFNMKTVMRGNL